MTVYMGAIILTELLMLTMTIHVLRYPGFTPAEKRWYLITFIAIFLCAGIELLAIHFDGRTGALSLPDLDQDVASAGNDLCLRMFLHQADRVLHARRLIHRFDIIHFCFRLSFRSARLP